MCLDLSNPYTINSIGLGFDIIGACLVAWEVSHQYRGTKFKEVGGATCGSNPEDPQTDEYKKYEKSKLKLMQVGLVLLVIGFCLQIYSNFLQGGDQLVSILNMQAKPQIKVATRNPQKNIFPAVAPIRRGKKELYNEQNGDENGGHP